MALIAVSGHPGCRFEEVARIAAQRLKFELLTQARIQLLIREEFGADRTIPDKAYTSLVTSILARPRTMSFTARWAASCRRGIFRECCERTWWRRRMRGSAT
jgi:hypothetical protein